MITRPSYPHNAIERAIREAIPKATVKIFEVPYDRKIHIAASRRLPSGKVKSVTRTLEYWQSSDQEWASMTHAIIRELTPRKPRPGAARSYVRQGRQPGALL